MAHYAGYNVGADLKACGGMSVRAALANTNTLGLLLKFNQKLNDIQSLKGALSFEHDLSDSQTRWGVKLDWAL